jgi:hypothetical protein
VRRRQQVFDEEGVDEEELARLRQERRERIQAKKQQRLLAHVRVTCLECERVCQGRARAPV